MQTNCQLRSIEKSLRRSIDSSTSQAIQVSSNGHRNDHRNKFQRTNGSDLKMIHPYAEINTIESHNNTHVSISKRGMFINSSIECIPSKIIRVDFNSDTYRSLNQMPLPLTQSTQITDTTSEDMNLNKESNGESECEPLTHDKFTPGNDVYVRVNIMEPNALWFKAKIVEFLKDSDQILVEVNFTIDDNGHVKPSQESEKIAVSKANLAFTSQPSRTLPVRSHVIAALTSGIIAEKPREENGLRYLIFFECGAAGYYAPSDVFEVADGLFDLDNCRADIEIHYKIFLQDYFTRYPSRIPIAHKLKRTIEFNIGSYQKPIWGAATVVKIDASCITVEIPSTLERNSYTTQVIYKASPKIKRIHNYICYYINKYGKFIPSVRPSFTPPLFGPRQESSSQHVKAYTLSIPRRRPNLSNLLHQEKSDLVSISISTNNIPVRGEKLFLIPQPQNQIAKSNAFYRPHNCDSGCIKIKIDLLALRGLNCFSLPMYFGFSRLKSFDEFFIYISPCGIKLTSSRLVERYLQSTNCILDIDHFTFDPISINNGTLGLPLKCINFECDIANGDEMQPISLINFWNDTKLDTSFIYESKRILDPQMQYSIDEPFLSCCDCKDNCINPETCSCIKLTRNDDFFAKCTSKGERSNGYTHKRLKQLNKFGIYECNSRCSCNKYCTNRVVQNGIKCVLQVFMTPDKGWGVRSLYDIPKGTFVSTYSAKVMRDESVNELDVYTANLDFIECAQEHKEGYENSIPEELRILSYENGYNSSSPNANSTSIETIMNGTHENGNNSPDVKCDSGPTGATGYSLRRRTGSSFVEMFNIKRKNAKPRSLREHLHDPEPYVLDAQKVGNIGRFYNHSCQPNLFIQNVFIDTHDLRLPHVAFFTNRVVHAMEELTWDYSYEIGSIPGRQMPCKCRSQSCRGRLL